ncbi:hydroxyisourate hydrolase [Euzebya sp.]|uniref:hydroxyisourate hydrolase n=1 Tax=Euzebya sp. TaxID=1971409 RepID=UPI00351242FB
MSLSTHVLDTAGGAPAVGVPVRVERDTGDGDWVEVARGETDDDGRIADLVPGDLEPGPWRITFDSGTWFADQGTTTFWGDIVVAFVVADPAAHHHVPLLLSPFGYSTYRGS